MLRNTALICILLLLSTVVQAKEVAGVQLPENISLANQTLLLNGSGIRSKFIFDIYVAAFYTAHPIRKMSEVSLQQPMRMAMYFVYDEVDKTKLVDAMNEGFADNLSAQELAAQADNISKVNGWFETMHKDDVVALDFVPGTGTVVTMKGSQKGLIRDETFYASLLKIWFGKDPVTEKLKNELLGVQQSEEE